MATFNCSSKILNFHHRFAIFISLKEKISKTQIAKDLGFSRQTIHNEINRGTIEQVDSLFRTYTKYDPYASETRYETASEWKGRMRTFELYPKLKEFVENKLKEKYSPEVIEEMIKEAYKRNEVEKTVSFKTIYRAIENKRICKNTKVSIYKKKKKRKRKPEKLKNKPLGGFSIEFRDKAIDTREEFGHREIDCVIGKKNGKTVVLMTLVERKTRYGLVFKLKNKSMEEVVKVLKALKKEYGDAYYKIFKTITCDNGAEFKDAVGMSLNSDDKGTKIYYSHSYCSYERGTNENFNRFIRRFFPKGTDFSRVSSKELNSCISFINNYPRKIHKFKAASELFEIELSKIIENKRELNYSYV